MISPEMKEQATAAMKAAKDQFALDKDRLGTAMGPNLDGNRGPNMMPADFSHIANTQQSNQQLYEDKAMLYKIQLEDEIIAEVNKGKKLDADNKVRSELQAGRAVALAMAP